MKAVCFLAVLGIFCFSGCSTPGSQYARAHPELSAAHREILIMGTIPGGGAVEGMTKEQVRLAVGNPTRVEKFNGRDVWIYVHQRFADMSPEEDRGSAFSSGSNSQRNFTETAHLGPRPSFNEVTGIFFDGDRATHSQIARERR
jgi:outer membrane protein assembly factor BamE (lipoprotein component of BamABCDE complex)